MAHRSDATTASQVRPRVFLFTDLGRRRPRRRPSTRRFHIGDDGVRTIRELTRYATALVRGRIVLTQTRRTRLSTYHASGWAKPRRRLRVQSGVPHVHA